MGECGAEDLVVAGSNPASATRLYKFPSLYEVAGVDTLHLVFRCGWGSGLSCSLVVGVTPVQIRGRDL